MRATGTLMFRVYTSDAFIPVEGATIVTLDEANGRLLGLRVTNFSGETEPLVLEAPAVGLSQDPEERAQPWLGVKVLVEQPAFERVTLEGVQVFPGVVTLQQVSLLPRQEFDPTEDSGQRLIFSPQPLQEATI